MISPQWQMERGWVNHVWLQNVLVTLNHAERVCFGEVRPRDIIKSLSEDINCWQEQSPKLASLLDRFETEMSPRIYFDFPPLSNYPKETRSWLEPLTHELWLKRGMREKIEATKAAYKKTDNAFKRCYSALARLSPSPAPDDLKPFCSKLQILIKCCQALFSFISALPHRVLCC